MIFHNSLIEALMWGLLFGAAAWLPVRITKRVVFHWKFLFVMTLMYSGSFLVARRTLWGSHTILDEIGDFLCVVAVIWILQLRGMAKYIMPPGRGEEWAGRKIYRVATWRQRMEVVGFVSIVLLLLWRLSVLGNKPLSGLYMAVLLLVSICLVFRLEVLAHVAGVGPELRIVARNSNLINRGPRN